MTVQDGQTSGVSLSLAPAYVERSLPALWDGEPVRWERGGEVEQAMVFICSASGRQRLEGETCASCGATSVVTWRGLTERVIGIAGAVWQARFHANRCTGCDHDSVVDLTSWEVWDLDESDYGPEGSVAPSDPQQGLW